MPADVRVEWNAHDFEAEVQRAVQTGLAAAAITIQGRVKANLNRPGEPRSKNARSEIRRGFALLVRAGFSPVQRALAKLISPRNRRDINRVEALEALPRHGGKFVDPPGGMPRRREGYLRKSIQVGVVGPDEAIVGSGPIAESAVEYAAIHEYGGMAGRKSHPVHIPARPYLRPSLKQVEGVAGKAFADTIARHLGGSPGA